jgi:hypothetical protein
MLDYLVIPTIKPPNTKTLSNSLEKKKPVKKIKEPPIIYK